MALTGMQFDATDDMHDFTPTAKTGYTISSAKYCYINTHIMYFEVMITNDTEATLSGTPVCTFPSSMKPKRNCSVNACGLSSQYATRSGSAFLNASNGEVDVFTSGNSKYEFITGIYSIT